MVKRAWMFFWGDSVTSSVVRMVSAFAIGYFVIGGLL